MSANRWDGIERPYIKEEVLSLRGSKKIEYTLAKDGARKLWKLLPYDSDRDWETSSLI